MRLSLCLLLIVGAVVVLGKSVPENVRNEMYGTRSGQVVVGSAIQEAREIGNLYASQPSQDASGEVLKSVWAEQVVDYLSFRLGSVSPANTQTKWDRSEYPKESMFAKKPRAGILVVLEGQEALSPTQSELLFVFSSLEKVSIQSKTLSTSPLNVLQTVLTGSPPSSHGIVADSWIDQHQGSRVDAFDQNRHDVDALSRVVSFTDMLALTHPASLISTVAGNSRLAAALAVSPRFSQGRQTPQQITYWNSAAAELSSTMDARFITPFTLTGDSALLNVLNSRVGLTISFDASENIVRVLFTNMPSQIFDLNDPADALLFHELHTIVAFITAFQSNTEFRTPLTTDVSLDLFQFGISSLSAYAPLSNKHTFALLLIDTTIDQVRRILSASYDRSRLFTTLITLSNSLPTSSAAALDVLASDSWLQEFTAIPVHLTFPHIYLLPALTPEQIDSSTEQIEQLLSPFSLHAFKALPSSFSHLFSVREDGGDSSDNETYYTDAEVAEYQILLWSGITLVVILLSAVCAMFSLHWDGEGSGLFITTTTVLKSHNE